ncbi:MAG: dihydroorotate dehydrogenase electron transfer subunit [Bacteroidales bacterium]|nr:dihydroorotate dehydrogenase electron transfer subunit [Bacteroidales bacterium]
MRKTALDMRVVGNQHLSANYSLLILKADDVTVPCDTTSAEPFSFPTIRPGQFVQVRVENSPETFLRRPISVNFVRPEENELHLLIRRAGKGTEALCETEPGDILNVILPLGNGFSIPDNNDSTSFHPLLVGGGVGVAPLLYLGKRLADIGIEPSFLLAAKSEKDLLLLESFREIGTVYISTDDGTAGVPGLVTANPALRDSWSRIYCCGPMPMMKGVAAIAHETGVPCEVSLENTMACGLGACLCCVEDTVDGHVCVCTEGPVFTTDKLKWNKTTDIHG